MDEDTIGHICLYLFEHEVHIELVVVEKTLDVTALADTVGQLVTAVILRTLENPNAHPRQSPVVRVH